MCICGQVRWGELLSTLIFALLYVIASRSRNSHPTSRVIAPPAAPLVLLLSTFAFLVLKLLLTPRMLATSMLL